MTASAGVGIPHARVQPDGRRECPACGVLIDERYDRTGEPLTQNYAAHYLEKHTTSAGEPRGQEGRMADEKVQDYVRGALRRAGEKVDELDPAQKARAVEAPEKHAGLRGKALAAWIITGQGLTEQTKQAAATRAASKGDKRKNGGVRASAYPEDVREAVRRVKEIKGTPHGSPGPKQHAHVREVVTAEVGGEPTAAQVVKASGAKDLKALVAIGSGKSEREDLKALRPLAEKMGDDAFCKGRNLAAILAAWVEQLEK